MWRAAALLARYTTIPQLSSDFPQLTPIFLQVKKTVNYAESSDEDEDVFTALQSRQSQRRNRAKTVVLDDEDDDFDLGNDVEADEDGMGATSSRTIFR